MSKIDDFFDVAEKALEPLEYALGEPKAIPKAVEPEVTSTHEAWEKAWEEPHWACAGAPELGVAEAWHAIPDATLTSVCGKSFSSDNIRNRGTLEHGKVIPACTSCIIAVSK